MSVILIKFSICDLYEKYYVLKAQGNVETVAGVYLGGLGARVTKGEKKKKRKTFPKG